MRRKILFWLFFVSGFCGLVYQVVWTRMAFAAFGIITPVLSVVISVFMLGLSLGAWAGGRWIGALAQKTQKSAIAFYGLAEFLIGVGAFAVPKLFSLGERLLLVAGQSNSFSYLFWSAVVLTCSILPWCFFMGTTFPFMMAFVREGDAKSRESFSYLYLANVLGAMCGTVITAVALIEIFGFHDTLTVAAAGNFAIAGATVWLSREKSGAQQSKSAPAAPAGNKVAAEAGLGIARARFIKWVLFSTGFASMALEVVWTRAFSTVLKTQVYSFALVVATYLGATFVGSLLYRLDLARQKKRGAAELLGFLCAAALLPVLINDTRLLHIDWATATHWPSAVALLVSICPLCGILGYLTPSLIDEYAAGTPRAAGTAYALNVLGCILGPLCACYLLLPWLSERHAQLILAVPFFAFFLWSCPEVPMKPRLRLGLAAGVLLIGATFVSRDFETAMFRTQKHIEGRRDYAASVISFGEGFNRYLLVNGIGMTYLTPITKFMVHLPLAFHHGPPSSALVICFGMGTTFRSALSWDIDTTAVELVPGVRDAFGFYHADAAQCRANPHGHIVIDDGRRFLKRTREKFDVIVIDPPPPPEAAGSSLLYSVEFYELAKQHLKPNGILQAWLPWNPSIGHAALRSLCDVFPHVRCFNSVERWGVHLLASMEPMEACSASDLAARLPPKARTDLLEWSPAQDLTRFINVVLSQETFTTNNLDPNLFLHITDDQPYNEYFLLRQSGLY